MPRNEAIQALLDAEAKYRLWDIQPLGAPTWALERLGVYRRLEQNLGSGDRLPTTQPKGMKRLHVELQSFRQSSERALRTVFSEGRDIWVLTSSHYRKPDAQGTFRCPMTHDLEEQLGTRLAVLEFNTARIDQAALPLEIASQHRWLDHIQIPTLGLARISAPAGWIVRGSGTSLVAHQRWVDRTVYGWVMERLARSWLRRAKPSAVFVVNGYGMFQPLQMAIKRAGIPLIELQHGMIHESHPGYVFGELMPRRQQPWPDHIVVFGKEYGRILNEASPYWIDRWTVGGHPWLRLAGSREKGHGPRTITFFGQYDDHVRAQIQDAAIAVRRHDKGSNRIAIKPHPREFEASRTYARAKEAGIDVLSHQDDTYEVLRKTDVAVCVFSTVAIEALAFGCTSFLLESRHWNDVLRSFVDRGVLQVAADGEDLAQQLASDSASGAVHSDAASELYAGPDVALDYEELLASIARNRDKRDTSTGP